MAHASRCAAQWHDSRVNAQLHGARREYGVIHIRKWSIRFIVVLCRFSLNTILETHAKWKHLIKCGIKSKIVHSLTRKPRTPLKRPLKFPPFYCLRMFSVLNSGATVIETKSTTPQWTTGENVASRVSRTTFIQHKTNEPPAFLDSYSFVFFLFLVVVVAARCWHRAVRHNLIHLFLYFCFVDFVFFFGVPLLILKISRFSI